MAQEDLDNYKQDTREAKTAEETIAWHTELLSDLANAEAAANAGVKDAAFINYAEALEAYADRPDIEDLDRRRARDFPEDFDAASFMRETGDPINGSGV